jgi:hypothetical protein
VDLFLNVFKSVLPVFPHDAHHGSSLQINYIHTFSDKVVPIDSQGSDLFEIFDDDAFRVQLAKSLGVELRKHNLYIRYLQIGIYIRFFLLNSYHSLDSLYDYHRVLGVPPTLTPTGTA